VKDMERLGYGELLKRFESASEPRAATDEGDRE